jgi:hypothetical protein
LASNVRVRMSAPAMRAVPRLGGTTPQAIEIVVVLPAPLGPSRPKISPRDSVRSIAWTAVRAP